MKIGIMGGTFDPIHNGHIMLGKYALLEFALDEIWIMPNGNPPHKSKLQIKSSAEDRLKMAELAIQGMHRFRLQDYEVKKQETSCSYQTLEYFKKQYSRDEFYFIIGADSLFSIETWVHPERIFPTCTILAAFRDDIDSRPVMQQKIEELRLKYHAEICLLSMPVFPVSSSRLREKLNKRESTNGLIPACVTSYIQEKGLYQNE